jgi:hypothetical protein
MLADLAFLIRSRLPPKPVVSVRIADHPPGVQLGASAVSPCCQRFPSVAIPWVAYEDQSCFECKGFQPASRVERSNNLNRPDNLLLSNRAGTSIHASTRRSTLCGAVVLRRPQRCRC